MRASESGSLSIERAIYRERPIDPKCWRLLETYQPISRRLRMSGQPGRMQLLDVAAQGRDGIRIRRGDIHANNLAQEARILAAARSDPFERATEPETLAIPTEGRIPSKGSRRERALGGDPDRSPLALADARSSGPSGP